MQTFDPVSMFKALLLQAQYNRSDARMEFMPVGQRIRDRLSWMRVLRLDLGGATPDERPLGARAKRGSATFATASPRLAR
ncbi:MAG: transposase [Pseudomonadota bacterium]